MRESDNQGLNYIELMKGAMALVRQLSYPVHGDGIWQSQSQDIKGGNAVDPAKPAGPPHGVHDLPADPLVLQHQLNRTL